MQEVTVLNPEMRDVESLLFAPYKFYWGFNGAIPSWAARLKIKPCLTKYPQKKLILLDPTQKAANKICWYAMEKVFVFTNTFPNWAQEIRDGHYPLWAMTMKAEQIVPANISIFLIDELAPEIRAHLNH